MFILVNRLLFVASIVLSLIFKTLALTLTLEMVLGYKVLWEHATSLRKSVQVQVRWFLGERILSWEGQASPEYGADVGSEDLAVPGRLGPVQGTSARHRQLRSR